MSLKSLGVNMASVCKKCWSMTTTEEGLKDLFSEHGFEHPTKDNLQNSDNQPCSFCNLLYAVVQDFQMPPRSKMESILCKVEGLHGSRLTSRVTTEARLIPGSSTQLILDAVHTTRNHHSRSKRLVTRVAALDIYSSHGR